MILNTLLSRDLLVDAYKFYSRGDARAHDALRIIIERNDMVVAVQGCLEQSIKEEEPAKQSLYLQAACFGKKFHPGTAIEEYPRTCKSIRVMNILRCEGIDPAIQFDEAIELLIAHRKHELALWIIKFLKIEGEAKVVSEWCEHLIGERQISDMQVAEIIQKILGPVPIVSYADIASKAIDRHRPQLAITLIEKETQSVKQIPLLLKLQQYDKVIDHAIASCDSNLIYMAIFRLRDLLSNEIRFIELLKKHRLASRFYCNYLAITDNRKLILISHRENPDDELVHSLLNDQMESALTVAKRTRRDVIPQQIEVYLRLSKLQKTFERLGNPPRSKLPWTKLSISDTIINLIALNQSAKAKDVQKKFDVSEKKYRVLEQIALNTLPKLTLTPIAT